MPARPGLRPRVGFRLAAGSLKPWAELVGDARVGQPLQQPLSRAVEVLPHRFLVQRHGADDRLLTAPINVPVPPQFGRLLVEPPSVHELPVKPLVPDAIEAGSVRGFAHGTAEGMTALV